MAGLTLRQEKFVQALTTPQTPTYCKPSASYRVISPSTTMESSHVSASRMLANAKVSDAVRGQLGIEQLGSKLKKCLRETEKLKDWAQVRETVMDYAKLTGQLVEKREVRSVDAQSGHAISELVQRSMRPSLRMVNTDGDNMVTPPITATLIPSAATVTDASVSKCIADTKSAPLAQDGEGATPPE